MRTRDRLSTRHAAPDDARATLAAAAGVLSARDPRLFHAGNQAFCTRLVRAALEQPEVASVRVALQDQSFRMEFARQSLSQPEMAERFAAAVNAALAAGETEASPRPWDTLAGFRGTGDRSLWAAAHQRPGALRLSSDGLCADAARASRLAAALGQVAGIGSSRLAWRGGGLVVRYDAARLDPDAVVAAAAEAWVGAQATEANPYEVATGLRRAGYLALAGGSFVLTVIGVIVPGMPTVPFLLVTSYYLVRSSPALNRRLLRSRLFGPILRDWQGHGGLSRSSKLKLVGLSSAASAVTLLAFTPPAGLVAVILVAAAVSTYSIVRLPGVAEEEGRVGRSADAFPIMAPAPVA